METPKAYREVGITYFVPPFTYQEEIYVGCYRLLPVVYRWKHAPTGREGTHTVYLFPEDVKRFPLLLAHWNRCEEWEYTLTNHVLVIL
jgi:hypothetical protein